MFCNTTNQPSGAPLPNIVNKMVKMVCEVSQKTALELGAKMDMKTTVRDENDNSTVYAYRNNGGGKSILEELQDQKRDIAALRAASTTTNREMGDLKQTVEVLEEKVEDLEEEVEDLEEKVEDLEEDQLEKTLEIMELQEQVMDRDASLGARGRSIFELKRNMQKLKEIQHEVCRGCTIGGGRDIGLEPCGHVVCFRHYEEMRNRAEVGQRMSCYFCGQVVEDEFFLGNLATT
ncbi:MAG: hypothetical protein SGILL_008350 [Bacillariaceae sp.]